MGKDLPPPLTIFEADADLDGGQEWHSDSIDITSGERVFVKAFTNPPRKIIIAIHQDGVHSNKLGDGGPYWVVGVRRSVCATRWKTASKPGSFRVVVRLPPSGGWARVHLTIQLHSTKPGRFHRPIWGSRLGPFKSWDAVEGFLLFLTISMGIFFIGYINWVIASYNWTELRVGQSPAVPLLQADAEWAIFFAALYVAVRQLPEWIRQGRDRKPR